jgi:signal transduction histidine kinase
MRIRTKLFLFVIPLAMLPLLLVGLYAYQSLLKGFEEQAYLADQQLCLSAAAGIEQILDECHDNLNLLSSMLSTWLSRPDERRLEQMIARENPIKEFAQSLALRYSPYLQIRLLAPEGKELFIARGLIRKLELGSALDDPIFLQAVSVSGQFPPQAQDRHGRGVTTFSERLIHRRTAHDQTLLGFVFLDLDLEAISKTLRAVAATTPGYYFLFDGSGRILADGGDAPLFETESQTESYQSLLQQIRANPKPAFSHRAYRMAGKRFFFSSRPVKEYIAFREPIPEERWYLGLVRAETPLFIAFRRSQILFFVILASGLAMAIGGAFFISQKITAPISRLALAAQKLAQGHLESRVEAAGGDEIGELAADFNHMAVDLKQLLSERRANETLLAIGKFSAALAHDLRNPVEGLKLLSRELCKRVGPGRQEYDIADTIVQSADRLSALVNQSLDFARLNQPVFVAVDLVALTDEVLQDFRFDGVALKKAFAPELPRVHADAAQIKRVLANLIRNALEACRSQRTSAPCRLSLTLQLVEEKIHLEIADAGPGIPQEIREKIFEPFFSTKPTGHGLGLALARQIIANHGGTIAFTSEMGQGAQFVIELPMANKL